MKNLKLMLMGMMMITILLTGCKKDEISQDELEQIEDNNPVVNADTKRSCASSEYLTRQLRNDPRRKAQMEELDLQLSKYMSTHKSQTTGAVYTIPIVVHVLYNNATKNISDAQIESQLVVLNNDFRRLNSDADNTWSQAADSEIEFCMAQVDPNGNTTNGITRTQTSVSSFGIDDKMKKSSAGGKDPWNTAEYLNVWVCDLGSGLLGYAQFPGGPAATDGVVVGYQYFGTTGTAAAPFNLGRTTTHEVGHYFNLYHIWGDGACGEDDLVADTPASDDANYGCTPTHTSCGSKDMVQNYMDYSDDVCMNLFTVGQKDRMRALLAAGGARASLLNSNACNGPGGGGGGSTPTCTDGVQNGSETGIDCGGSCAPCDTGVGGDAGVRYIYTPKGMVSTASVAPQVRIRNYGSNKLTSVDIVYGVQGEPSQSYNWTGNLLAGKAVNVNLPAITLLTGANKFEAKTTQPNGGNDSNPQNDKKVSNYDLSNGTGSQVVTVKIKPDDYGSEIFWEIYDEDLNIVAEGGGYPDFNTTIKTKQVTLDDGCYTFAIYDDFGDGICCDWGNGWYKVLDENGQEIVGADGQYGYYEEQDFCTGGNFQGGNIGSMAKRTALKQQKVLEVLQGRTNDKRLLNIENPGKSSNLYLINEEGKTVKTYSANEIKNLNEISVVDLPNGQYRMQLGSGKKAINTSFIILN